jgi:hypothetical protein
MPFSPGDKLGPYEILAPLFAGRMGEVYRARDARLKRDATIKVPPAALANDAQYMARFEREARMPASLNHPNIATACVEQGALVMELVEGLDLKGPLTLDEAIPVARQTHGEKTVEAPAALPAEQLLLDCGQRGVAAEVWVNGEPVRSRPWAPFVFEVSRRLRPGRHDFRVRVANAEANARAVGTWLDILKNLDLSGWLGPVQLVSYFERSIASVRV